MYMRRKLFLNIHKKLMPRRVSYFNKWRIISEAMVCNTFQTNTHNEFAMYTAPGSGTVPAHILIKIDVVIFKVNRG